MAYTLAVGCDNFGSSQSSPYLQLWDPSATNGAKSSLVFNGQSSIVKALKYYNETILISGSDDHFVRIWNLITGSPIITIDTLLTVNSLITLANGKLVTAGGNLIKLWYIDTGTYIKEVTHNTVNVLEVLDDGFASGGSDNFIKIWNNSGDWKNDLDAKYPVISLKRISSNLLASGLEINSHILVWFLNNQSVKCDVSDGNNKVSLELLSDGYLASGSVDGWIKIWDVNAINCPKINMNYGSPSHSGSINALKLLDTNIMASASIDKTIKIWNTATATQINIINNNLQNYALELLGPSPLTFTINSPTTTTFAPTTITTPATTMSTQTSTIITTKNFYTTTSETSIASFITTTITSTIADTTKSTDVATTLTSFQSISTNELSTQVSTQSLIQSETSHLISTSQSTTVVTSSMSFVSTATPVSSLQNLLNSLTNSFDLYKLTIFDFILLLNSNFTLSNCIYNCTNHGLCKYASSENNFICSCNSVYNGGSACQTDSRACSSNPCMNNATCIDQSFSLFGNITNNNNKSYICICPKYFYGPNCENKIDICENETCSNNGKCIDKNNNISCECYYLYEGDKCNIQSSELKLIKVVSFTSFIIAIIIIILTYLLFILCDISKYFMGKNNFADRKAKEFNSKIKIRELINAN